MLSEVSKCRDKITYSEIYPGFKFRDHIYGRPPQSRDFEIYVRLVGYSRKLLEKTIGLKNTEEIFVNMDKSTYSAYLCDTVLSKPDFLAVNRPDKDFQKEIDIINKCIAINPREPLFYYIKALLAKKLMGKYIIDAKTSNRRLDNKKIIALQNSILENAEKAVEIDPCWKLPRQLLKDRLLK